MMRNGRRRVAALTLLLAFPVLASGQVSHAQDVPTLDDRTEVPVQVSLGAIDAIVTSGGSANWTVIVEHVGVADPEAMVWEQVEVVAELHAALGSRSALRAALAGGSVPPLVARELVTSPVGPVGPGSVLRIDGSVPLVGPALNRSDSAVHPLRLLVIIDGTEVDRISTAVVRIGADPATRLATTLVWPLEAAPARDADGDPSTGLDPLTVAGGRLDTLLAALEPVVTESDRAADATDGAVSPLATLAQGVALAPGPHLLEDLRRRGDDVPAAPDADAVVEPVEPAALRAALLLDRLRRTARTLPSGPLITPYGDANLTGILATGPALRPTAGRSMLEGAQRLPALTGRDTTPVVLLRAPLAPAVLDLLPVRTVIVPYEALETPDLALDIALGEPLRSLRSPTGPVFTALVGDPYLTAALGASTREQPGDPLLAAHDLLVRTAMVHLEAPGREGRSLVLLPPETFDPDPRFAAELLARLASAPWIAPTPPALLAGTDVSVEPARLREQPPEPLPARLTTALAATERDLALLVGALDPEAAPDDVVPVGARTLTEAADELLRATSRAFVSDVEQAVSLLSGVRDGVDGAFGSVTLDVADVTLTDRDGTVPMTLTRTSGLPLRIRVEVAGPAALTWPDGRVRELTLAPGEERTLEVPVRSGATGRFPVTVRVSDPSGERLLGRDVIGVRATALAGPALAVIATTVTVLLIVGVFRQRRRGLALRTAADLPDDLEPERQT